jgi:nifR3 family TIM-barrel protein
MNWTPPKIALAPMAGITDAPFRAVVAGYGCDLLVSEMIASGEMFKEHRLNKERFEHAGEGIENSVQLAGRDPDVMHTAAKYLVSQGVQMIDINMGCPAKKVISGAAGAALMRELPLARQIIEAVATSGVARFSVKMRLGWDDETRNAAELAYIAQECGAVMIVVHGRTRAQFYKGSADWDAVGQVVRCVDLPVLVNGDIGTADQARDALLRSGAQGVMIGRAALGAPWRLAQIRAQLLQEAPVPDPSTQEILRLSTQHYRDMLDFYPEAMGYRIARKHLGWYMDYARTPAHLRREILQSTDPQDVMRRWPDALGVGTRDASYKEQFHA